MSDVEERRGGRTGLLILRVWVEEDAPHAFKVRVMTRPDLFSPEVRSRAASSIDEVRWLVGEFLEEFLAGAGSRW
jgi:hypothetical protein